MKEKRYSLVLVLLSLLMVAIHPKTTGAETTNCTAITSVPYTINAQGVYCFTGHLSTGLGTGNMITINVNNVILDLNGYKLGGQAAGLGTQAIGIYAYQRQNITIRNGTVRGFLKAIVIDDSSPYTTSQGHLIEDIRADMNTYVGMEVSGRGVVVRNNHVVDTGGSTGGYINAYGIIVQGPGAKVIGNNVFETAERGYAASSVGVRVNSGPGSVVEDNRIGNEVMGSGTSTGVEVNTSNDVVVVDNRIATMIIGVNYAGGSTGKYRDNILTGVTTPYIGGTEMVRGDITGVAAGTGLEGGGLSGDVTLSVAQPYRLPQGCSGGQIASWNGSSWVCATDQMNIGDITAVNAGTGLTGGATSGDATLSVSFGGNGSATTVSRSDHNHDDRYYNKAYVNALEARIAALEAKLSGLTRSGNDFIITNANLYIQNGSGTTGGVNGKGNLIIGYNELRQGGDDRTGSHNLIVGSTNNYSSYGGIVVGYWNTISGPYSSVSGGSSNTASYVYSSVSGGANNTASGWGSSVSGGAMNTASGSESWVSGGDHNTASGVQSSVSGGGYNIASGDLSSVAGGGWYNASYGNRAFGHYSAILGGYNNTAGDPALVNHNIGQNSTVSGGSGNTASGTMSSVSGGDNNTASGYSSSVTGGRYNIASGDYSSVAGGGAANASYGNRAFGHYSAILGGYYNTAGDDALVDHTIGQNSTVSGGWSNTASGSYSSASGGSGHTASGIYSSVSGGTNNTAAAGTLRSAEVHTEVQAVIPTGLQEDYGRIIDTKIRTSQLVLFLVLQGKRYGEADTTRMAFEISDDVLSSTYRLFDIRGGSGRPCLFLLEVFLMLPFSR